MSLHLTEATLDWVVFRTIADIENRHDIELRVVQLYVLLLMHAQLIHEERKRLVAVLLA